MNWISAWYFTLVRLYPRTFRENYGEEMRFVFQQALAEAQNQGLRAVLVLLLTEAMDLPASIAREHWHIIQQGSLSGSLQAGGSPGDATVSVGGGPERGTWGQALLAGLPLILLSLLMGLPPLIKAAGYILTNSAINRVAIVIGIPLVGCSLVFLFLKKRSNWIGSWYPFFLVFIIAVVGWAGSLFGEPRGWDLFRDLSQRLFMPLAIAYLLYRVARFNRIQAVLASLPFMMVVWTPFLERTPKTGLTDGMVGGTYLATLLLAGLAAIIIMRVNRLGAAIAAALAVSATAGLLYSFMGIYYGGVMPFAEPFPTARVVLAYAYTPILAISFSLLIGPQLARIYRDLGLRSQPHGRIWYRVALLGLLLVMVGVILQSAQITTDYRIHLSSLAVPAMLYGGMLVYAGGYLKLYLAGLQSGILPGWPVAFLLFLLPLGVPVTLFIGIQGLLNPIVPGLWALLLVCELAWSALSFWLVMHFARRYP